LLDRLKVACELIDLPAIRSALMEAVDGFEPKEEIADPLWNINRQESQSEIGRTFEGSEGATQAAKKVTHLFKE